ncbi:MAG: hypothetical protein KKB50_19665 [Planctomycetes bacterium]|nr:hypothetical protein [Planctomycetota bacterium]
MADVCLAGVLHTAAEKWLGVKAGGDGITWFDLLAIPERAPVADVPRCVEERRRQIEQLSARAQAQGRDDYATVIGQLRAAVDAAGLTLGEASRRDEYLAALRAARRSRFEKTIAPSIVAGRKPDGAQLEALLKTAGQLRLPESEARRVIDQLAGLEAADNPAVDFGTLRASDLAAYGVLRVADDRAWPTYFDVLQIDEATESAQLIQSQANSQSRRAQEREAKFTEMTQKRKAREFIELVKMAEETLLSPERRSAHLREIQEKRRKRLQEEVRLAVGGDGVSADAVIRLLVSAQRMRLPDVQARQVITAETGFADYFGLVGERRSAVLNCVGTMEFKIERPDDPKACSRPLTIRNDGGATLECNIRSAVDWISVEPRSKHIARSESVTVTVDAGKLPRGVPTTGQVQVDSNGGSRIVTVEATVAGGRHPSTTAERVWGGIAFLAAATLIGPVVLAIVFQRRSRYVAFQAAQSAVLGAAFWASELLEVIGNFLCLAKLVEIPVMILSCAILIVAAACAIASFCGRGIWLPVVADRATKFL